MSPKKDTGSTDAAKKAAEEIDKGKQKQAGKDQDRIEKVKKGKT